MASFEKTTLEAPPYEEKHLSTNEKSLADGATVVGSDASGSHDYDGDLPDPDAGKSDEERARLVRPSLQCCSLGKHR
jgi:hypothetical protein